MNKYEPHFLIEGHQSIGSIADRLSEFISAATSTLHMSIYDFRVTDIQAARQVVSALADGAERGVDVRIAYDHRNAPKFGPGDDPAPHGTHDFLVQHLQHTKVRTRFVGTSAAVLDGGSGTLHHKYLVRDGRTSRAAVWTGSTNFTDDAWTHQDNNILVVTSPQLCAFYETDFEELWCNDSLYSSGVNDMGSISVDGVTAEIMFSPGSGHLIERRFAEVISQAQRSVHIISTLIASGAVLDALCDVVDAGRVSVRGIFDGPEMTSSSKSWPASARRVEQQEQLRRVLATKRSRPYSPGGVDNGMRNKFVVADNQVITASGNLWLSMRTNAENAILINDEDVANAYRDYAERLLHIYAS
jgi:phosphatidylserine/phosphatidylglycerophosphate/cardiolipin synthase-like enzyme